MLDQNGQPVQQQQPQFPMTNVSVSPQGLIVQIVLAPGVMLQTVLNEETMNQVTKLWLETRKQIQDQLKMIEHVRSTKLN